mgnify:FL=1
MLPLQQVKKASQVVGGARDCRFGILDAFIVEHHESAVWCQLQRLKEAWPMDSRIAPIVADVAHARVHLHNARQRRVDNLSRREVSGVQAHPQPR